MTAPAPTTSTVRALLAAGLTVRDVADLLRADPRAIEQLARSAALPSANPQQERQKGD